MNQKPIPVSTFEDAIPHRPPMVWIDNVLWADDKEGECEVLINKKAHYCNEKVIRQSSLIEWMAQSFGFCRALHWHQTGVGTTLKKAYLAAFQDFTFPKPFTIDEHKKLIVRTRIIRQRSNLFLVHGEIKTEKPKQLLSHGRLTLFALSD
jgi:predicted hotdog family 3-hydroxylacyl-ACP dehydratase